MTSCSSSEEITPPSMAAARPAPPSCFVLAMASGSASSSVSFQERKRYAVSFRFVLVGFEEEEQSVRRSSKAPPLATTLVLPISSLPSVQSSPSSVQTHTQSIATPAATQSNWRDSPWEDAYSPSEGSFGSIRIRCSTVFKDLVFWLFLKKSQFDFDCVLFFLL
ncbi:hypothetical protein BDY24DRAFT_403874 [Mrakia frigida]|uniref:uncharacterized protein n=1 Tax=Mrakia frigida TaxID=29902 RepID=UPI003FCC0E2A